MKKRAWKTRLKNACEQVGTYKPEFDITISLAASYAEQIDALEPEIAEEGPVIEQTNKSGFTNIIKNPKVTVYDDLRKSFIACLRELGLTPAGLKKINEEVFMKIKDEKNENNLIGLLKKAKAEKEDTNGE